MESPVKNTSGESPDVTGVSRSGRVRKKSSKLADFESPDEIDTRFKRKTDRPQKSPQKGSDVYDESDGEIDDDLLEVKDEPLEVDDWGDNDDGDEDIVEGDDNDDGDEGNDPLHVDDDSTDMPRETSNYSQAQSLYLSEKQGKKNIMLKDGQVVQRKKAQRKDKGKSRFTAYMLWAREIRPGIIQANPNMDFSAVNKRLGELWALVPTTQKYNWKRRAKRLAAKGNQKGSMISTGKAAKQSQNTARSNLINKGGVKPQQVVRTSSKQSDVGPPAPTQKAHTSTPKTSRSVVTSISDHSPPSAYKVTGSSPIDVAAHIKLLGESLNNIGQKLKEHEGQIAVSGSLSVLLDSMLCVLGPLTCLTAQVEEIRGAVPEPTLMNILDNIAYIMPGIV
ncbi:HMG box-containing protein 4-like isoform X1 [Penaeus chinensis]|uniref:HMG box-containing protein 4-like isoform X1 n=1 Tax=Penaeus chinensis TaxID=139456 RepID=UPI001FB5DDC8|nr:HMG box-containing protein 4-like isoform X1 [Penaeus chinensis]